MKGRIWSRIGTRVWPKSRWVASSAGFSACLRDQRQQRRAQHDARSGSELARPSARPQGRRELVQRLADRRLLVGEVAERRVGGVDEARPAAASLSPSSWAIRRKLWIDAARCCAPPASACRSGRGRGRTARSAAGRPRTGVPGRRARVPPPSSSSARYSRVSASSVARNASRLTFGSVWASGMVEPSDGVSPAVPGSTSITMSLRPVFGRSSSVASGWISSMYFGSMSMRTTASPVFEVDRADLADLDAGDVDRLALARGDRLRGGELGVELVEVLAEAGDPVGSAAFCWEKMHEQRRTARSTASAMIADEVPRSGRGSRFLMASGRLGLGGPAPAAGPFRFGTRVLVAGDVGA